MNNVPTVFSQTLFVCGVDFVLAFLRRASVAPSAPAVVTEAIASMESVFES